MKVPVPLGFGALQVTGSVVMAESIRELLKRAPFEPFELITSAGERHVVKHPEFAILLPSRIVITDPAADRVSIVSLIHLTEARMLSPGVSNNGGK